MKGINVSKAPSPNNPDSRPSGAWGQKKAKELLQTRLSSVGVKGVDKMTLKQLNKELKRLKAEGVEVPDMRTLNHRPVVLSTQERITEMREAHLMEEVEVTIRDRKTGEIRSEKKATMYALLDMLRHEALMNKSIPATKEYFDRTLGKAKQEVEMSGEIKVDEQRLPTAAEKAAAAAYIRALDEEE